MRALFPSRRRSAPGFTLVEVLIGASIGSIVLLGVLTSFLMITRSSARLVNYSTMEQEARHMLEVFAEDVRMCQSAGVTYNSGTSMTLTVVGNYTGYANQVTYSYGSATIGGVTTSNCFYRRPGNASSTATPEILMHNVTSCAFARYDGLGNGGTGAAGSTAANGTVVPADAAIKRIELTLTTMITSVTTVAATEHIVSATYVLRN